LLEELQQTLLQEPPLLLTVCVPAHLICTHPMVRPPEKFLILPRDTFTEFPSAFFSRCLYFSAIQRLPHGMCRSAELATPY